MQNPQTAFLAPLFFGFFIFTFFLLLLRMQRGKYYKKEYHKHQGMFASLGNFISRIHHQIDGKISQEYFQAWEENNPFLSAPGVEMTPEIKEGVAIYAHKLRAYLEKKYEEWFLDVAQALALAEKNPKAFVSARDTIDFRCIPKSAHHHPAVVECALQIVRLLHTYLTDTKNRSRTDYARAWKYMQSVPLNEAGQKEVEHMFTMCSEVFVLYKTSQAKTNLPHLIESGRYEDVVRTVSDLRADCDMPYIAPSAKSAVCRGVEEVVEMAISTLAEGPVDNPARAACQLELMILKEKYFGTTVSAI